MTEMPSNQTFIIAAYAVTWIVLLGYQLHLTRRGKRAREEHDRLARGEGQESFS